MFYAGKKGILSTCGTILFSCWLSLAVAGLARGADTDYDGVDDAIDNCLGMGNPLQKDQDGDGIGDICEPGAGNTDADEDGIHDAVDNCLNHPNPLQYDTDGDGIGNVCEPGSGMADSDMDGIPDNEDNCRDDPNPRQYDLDKDTIGAVCDPDISDKDQSTIERALNAESGAMAAISRSLWAESSSVASLQRSIAAEEDAFLGLIYERNAPGPVFNCTGCHAQPLFDRIRQIVEEGGDFSQPLHHVTGIAQDIDCLACHYTGDHKSGIVKLVDPDQATDIIYQYDPANPSALGPFCRACHDGDGARSGFGTRPFSDGVSAPDHHAAHNSRGYTCVACHVFGDEILVEYTCTDCHSGTSQFNAHAPAHGGGNETSCQTCHAEL